MNLWSKKLYKIVKSFKEWKWYKLKKIVKILITLVILIIGLKLLLEYASTTPMLFKANYDIDIPYPSTEYSYLNEDSRDSSYFDVLTFQEDLQSKNLEKFHYIADDSEIYMNIMQIYLDGVSEKYRQLLLDEFPFEVIQNGNYIYIQLTGRRVSILIYDAESKTLYRLSHVIFILEELVPYRNYITIKCVGTCIEEINDLFKNTEDDIDNEVSTDVFLNSIETADESTTENES